MTEAELVPQLVLLVGELVAKTVSAIIAAQGLTAEQKKVLLAGIDASLTATAAKVAAVKF